MLNPASPEVQQQIKDGILALNSIEYALCLTEVCPVTWKDNNCHTTIVSHRWYESPRYPKSEKTSHIKCDASLLKRFKEKVALNNYHETVGADGTRRSAEENRNTDLAIIAELEHPQRRWFVVYHDDKYLYDYETNCILNVEQPHYVTTDLTIFNN